MNTNDMKTKSRHKKKPPPKTFPNQFGESVSYEDFIDGEIARIMDKDEPITQEPGWRKWARRNLGW